MKYSFISSVTSLQTNSGEDVPTITMLQAI